MNISPSEAEEALATIQRTTQKTRHSFASSGAYIFLILTGVIWLIGFLGNQFLTGAIVGTIWITISVIGTALSFVLGSRVRGPATIAYTRRIGVF